jgi:hypothetical protein
MDLKRNEINKSKILVFPGHCTLKVTTQKLQVLICAISVEIDVHLFLPRRELKANWQGLLNVLSRYP